jgi:hypothetical protein
MASCLAALTLLLGGLATSGRADLIWRIAQTTPPAGVEIPPDTLNAATFSVFIASTVNNQSLLGADFTLALSSNSGAGGRLESGSNVLLPVSSNPDGFFAGSFPGFSVSYSTLANTAVTLGTTESLLATVTLSTVGATPGSYSAVLSGLDAVDGGFNQLATSSSSTLLTSYTISAVPEPTSMALVCVAGAGLMVRFRRRSSLQG